MRQCINRLWGNSPALYRDKSLINFESTHRHLIIFMRQFNSRTLWWSLILNLKMLLGNCLRKCCWIVPKSMFLSCFLYKFSWFPSHTVMLTGRFGPARGILTRVVSAWVVKGPFLHFSLIFSQNLTPAHLSIRTHNNNAYIITFRLWPKQPKTEMTNSENWLIWPTYQVRNDPPPKFGWNNQIQINPEPKWPAFPSISRFNPQQVPINEALSKFH